MKQVWSLPWGSAEKSTQDQYLNVGSGSHEHWLRAHGGGFLMSISKENAVSQKRKGTHGRYCPYEILLPKKRKSIF